MSDSKIIRNKLRRMLPTLDLETATQRTIQEQLEDELGIALDDYKAIIKAEVDAFLLGIDPEEAEEAAAPAQTKSPYTEPPAKKARQEFAAAAVAAAGPSNPAAATGTSTADALTTGPGDFLFSAPLSKMRFAGIRTFKNRGMVDIREFYEKDGVMAPGAKGLAMSPEQWHSLTSGMVSINDALSRTDESYFVDLGSNKRASISALGGKIMVSLREHYEKDGKMLPGKKGISLPPDQWMKLCAVHEELTEKLAAQPGGVPAAGKSPAKPAGAAVVAGAGDGAGPSASANAAPMSERKGNADATISVVLAPMRRAEVTRFKGKLVVDIREFYDKDGALAHTKKGLQMDPQQFQVLTDGANDLSAALQAQNTDFELLLSPKCV
jgi:Transcriptional Coactivator p15 (PC4)/DEK C terminal domain